MKTFELGQDEHIVAIFRKHPFYIWITIFKYIVIAIIPALVSAFIGNSLGNLGEYGMILYLAFLIVLWIAFFIEYTDFMLDTWVLTNERLVDVEQLALFSRRISTLSLDRIQDITIQQIGFVDTLLGIGTVFIQTAGTEDEFRILGMRNPSHVKDIIMQTYQGSKDRVFEKIAELR
jgi:uncharacterized membrane protein YdbT with pleckstrin-like domain